MIIAIAAVMALLAVLVGVLLAAFDGPLAETDPRQRMAEPYMRDCHLGERGGRGGVHAAGRTPPSGAP